MTQVIGCVQKIISGGQTGVDRAALDWAIAHGIAHGGWCPRHRKANDGALAAHYLLQETDSSGYSQRTRLNVQAADATLIIGRSQLVGGSQLTSRFAYELGKSLHVVHLTLDWTIQIEETLRWLDALQVRTLNIAGPSEERNPGIYEEVSLFLTQLHTD